MIIFVANNTCAKTFQLYSNNNNVAPKYIDKILFFKGRFIEKKICKKYTHGIYSIMSKNILFHTVNWLFMIRNRCKPSVTSHSVKKRLVQLN